MCRCIVKMWSAKGTEKSQNDSGRGCKIYVQMKEKTNRRHHQYWMMENHIVIGEKMILYLEGNPRIIAFNQEPVLITRARKPPTD